MNVLEKILEEIEKEQNSYEADHAWNYSKGLEYAKEIIRSHMSEKEKVSSVEIISRDIGGKPYYEIKYKKVGEDHYTVGYSSYFLDYVIDWLNNYFEFCREPKIVVDVAKDTNVPSNDDDYTMFTQNEDGVAEIYCDTYDIIIHCESSEEQKRVGKILEHCKDWIPVEERLPEVPKELEDAYCPEFNVTIKGAEKSYDIKI